MSQGVYKILTATEGRTYTSKHGDLVVWNVTLENAQPENGAATFELHKKPGNTPEPGDMIEVKRFSPDVYEGNPFVRIFLESTQGGGGSSTGGGGGSTGQRTPDQQRSIVRQHSQEMALRLIAATGDADELNLSEAGIVAAYLNGTVKRLTDWFAKDAAVEQAAPPPAQVNGGGEVPADTTGLHPAASTADDQIPF